MMAPDRIRAWRKMVELYWAFSGAKRTGIKNIRHYTNHRHHGNPSTSCSSSLQWHHRIITDVKRHRNHQENHHHCSHYKVSVFRKCWIRNRTWIQPTGLLYIKKNRMQNNQFRIDNTLRNVLVGKVRYLRTVGNVLGTVVRVSQECDRKWMC